MGNFEFIHGDKEILDTVEPLWNKLRKHHEIKSNHFSNTFKNFTFEQRKKKFSAESNMKVDLIRDKNKDLYIGYCISTISEKLIGEVDSLFVEQEYRKFGLGDSLMKRALEWLNSNKAKTIIIGVAEGNEDVLEFYQRYGFYKRRIILEQISKREQ